MASQIAMAKTYAEEIQAEAKARARLEGEASIIYKRAMDGVTLKLETSLREKKELESKILIETGELSGEKIARSLLVKQMAAMKLSIDKSAALAITSTETWKKEALTKASDMAARIQAKAEARARAEW